MGQRQYSQTPRKLLRVLIERENHVFRLNIFPKVECCLEATTAEKAMGKYTYFSAEMLAEFTRSVACKSELGGLMDGTGSAFLVL